MTDFDSVAVRLGGSTPPTVAQGTFTAIFTSVLLGIERAKNKQKMSCFAIVAQLARVYKQLSFK